MTKKPNLKVKDAEISEKDTISITENVALIEHESTDKIAAKFKEILGTDEWWKKLVVFYFQALEKYEGAEPLEIIKDDYIHLMIGMLDPNNPNTLVGVVPIAFKENLFTLTDDDINGIIQYINQEFPRQMDVYKERTAEEAPLVNKDNETVRLG